MDETSRRISDYVAGAKYDLILPANRSAISMHLLDALACCIGAHDAVPVQIANAVSAEVVGRPGSRVFILGTETSIEMAAFTNGIMVRYLDYNDMGGGGHPSDGVPSLIAVADAHHLSGRQLMVAIAVHYEVMRMMSPPVSIRERGWDQGVAVAVGVAAAVAGMLGGNAETIAHALALAVVPNISLRQTRAGHLSMWKGAATPAAARSGVFAAKLALAGMTGPDEPFEGENALFEQVSGPFDLVMPDSLGDAVAWASMKFWPVEGQSQSILEVIEEIRKRVKVEAIASIAIGTYWLAYDEIGREPEKWRPDTRETADHSLPFLVASTLLHGVLTKHDFSETRYRDPKVLSIMDKVSVFEDPAFTKAYPDVWKSRVDVGLVDGAHLVEMATYPHGNRNNPMTSDEVRDKFYRMAGEIGTKSWADKVRGDVENLPALADVASLVDLLASPEFAPR